MINTSSLDDARIWEIIYNFKKIKVGIINLPTSYPPHRVNGFLISGFPVPDSSSDFVYPKALKEELDSVVGGYRVDIQRSKFKGIEELIVAANEIIDMRVKVFKYVRRNYDPDFFILVFTSPDRIQHRLWNFVDTDNPCNDEKCMKYRGLIYDYWSHLDESIGEILDNIEDDTSVFIMSDHGFGPQKEIFYINKWLRRKGYIRFNKGLNSKKSPAGFRNKLYYILKYKSIPILLRNILPYKIREYFECEIPYELYLKKIDWSKTVAFSPPHTSVYGTVYLNLKGREKQGSVDKRDYYGIREEIISRMKLLEREYSDFKIRIFRREDIYRGDYTDRAPDIVYIINNFRCINLSSIGFSPLFQRRTLNEKYSGTHRMEGIFLARGPEIRENFVIKGANITDICPTLLHYLDIPVPEDIDGEVLKDIYKEGSKASKREIRTCKPLDIKRDFYLRDTKEEELKEKLKDLGYI